MFLDRVGQTLGRPTAPASLTATNDGRPLAGATVTIANSGAAGGDARGVTSDGSGNYSVTLPVTGGLVPYTVQGPSLLPRGGFITAGTTRGVNLDAIVMDSTFPLARAADAHRRLETSQHIGKIVLTT